MIEYHNDNAYMRGFLSNLYLRPSCHSCAAKSFKSGSDITLADFWGVDILLPEFNDDKGVSLVIVNSDKGDNIYNQISKESVVVIADVFRFNSCALEPVEPHKNRTLFFERFSKEHSETLSTIISDLTRVSLTSRVMNKIKRVIKKIVNI